ncbi:MAG: hypothetical protein COW65_05945 [Cytophagales bacterium CG18_big_fil_WC_8_21_14_2_50_42_9]|nr:MAG: hypothetical protein COW65_05945 [Cytophagales bacterium CG18_big_fil_WC_8_21_14_2_50_42_9]
MKIKLFSILLFCSVFAIKAFAQGGDGVENVHSAKLTYLGLSYSYEHAIGKQAVINGELKLATGFGANYFYNEGKTWHVVYPMLRLEPRYYYNFIKRAGKGKKIINNSANYLALSINKSFDPIIKTLGVGLINEFSAIPKWGIKRTIGQHFFYETAIGVGYRYNRVDKSRASLGFDLQLGYAF